MVRIILGLVAGVVAGFVTVMAVEWIGHLFYPLPADVNLSDPEQAGAIVAQAPVGAKLFVVGGWFAGALAGGLVARRISERAWAAWLIAVVIALAGIANVLMIPHPFWMQLAAVVAPLLGGLIAAHAGRSRLGATAGDRRSAADAL